jgi:hypothetical protein
MRSDHYSPTSRELRCQPSCLLFCEKEKEDYGEEEIYNLIVDASVYAFARCHLSCQIFRPKSCTASSCDMPPKSMPGNAYVFYLPIFIPRTKRKIVIG